MSNFINYFKEKLVWIGAGAILLIVLLLCTALVYPTVSLDPKDIPVAILVQDKGVNIPHKVAVNFGNTIKEKVTDKKSNSPLKWTVVSSKKSLNYGFDHEKYYGAIVVSKDFSKKLLSVQSKAPSPANVTVYINQGMNYNITNMVKQAFTQIIAGMNSNFRHQLMSQIGKRAKVVTLPQTQFLSLPIITKTLTVHSVGSHSSSGNSPASLSQISWISVLIGSICLYLAAKKSSKENSIVSSTAAQIIGGVVVSILVSSCVLFIADWGFGMHIYDTGKTWLFITFACCCFYLFQTSILNLIGIFGAAICMLLFFFTNPILSMGKELIPSPTYDLIYQWVPLRFSAEGLRDILFFHKDLNLSAPIFNLTLTGIICFCVILVICFIQKKKVNISNDN